MSLTKKNVDISFAKGLDLKTDPFRVPVGNFLNLTNTIFNKTGLLTKRNGYADLAPLPNTTYSYLTTLSDNLTAIGSTIAAYNETNETWVSRGSIQPMEVATLPLIRNNINQIQVDTAVSTSGLVCTVYTETDGTNTYYKYAIADAVTGQNIVAPTLLPAPGGTVTGSPRVFLLGKYFIIAFTNTIGGTAHLQYIAVNINTPTLVTVNADIAASYEPSSTVSWDAVVVNTRLYFAYPTATGGQSVQVTYITSTLAAAVLPTPFAGYAATLMTLAVDATVPSVPVIYISFYNSSGMMGYTAVVDQNLNIITATVLTSNALTVLNMTSAAQNGSMTLFREIANNYLYDGSIPTHYIRGVTVSQAGMVGTFYNVIRSVGLASKAFLVNTTITTNVVSTYLLLPTASSVLPGTLYITTDTGILYISNGIAWSSDQVIYFLSEYWSTYQPTYFLINGSTSTQAAPVIVAKLAYENGGGIAPNGYLTLGLPNVTVTDQMIGQVGYLYKDLIAAVNKNTNVPLGTHLLPDWHQPGDV